MKLLCIIASALLFHLPLLKASAQAPRVAEVIVQGNQQIPTDTILSVLRTQVGSDFSETVMNADLERIRRLGFFYEDTVRPSYELTPEGARVTFTLEEHPVIQQIVFTGNTVIPEPELRNVLTTKTGEVMNSGDVAKDVGEIRKLYLNKGYVAEVGATDPEQMVSREGVLTIPIIEAVVEAIEITGNRKTKTSVIRREIRTKPGQPFNFPKLQKDLERIYNLNLFEDIGPPDLVPTEPGRLIIRLPVKEKKTGQVTLGLGFSSPQGIVGRVELGETNFRGRGEGVNLLFEMGGRARRSSYELGFYEPYIDKKHTSLSASVFNKVIYRFANRTISGPVINSGNDLFNEIRQGGQVSLTRPLTDTNRVVLGLRSENISLNLSSQDQNNPNLPQFVRQEGRISTITTRNIRDTRDILIDPAKGQYLAAGVDLGDADVKPNVKGNFVKTSLDYRRYFSKGPRKNLREKKTVIAGRVLLGTMSGKIPFSEQFFVGGAETMRGYLESRFWGTNMFLANLEYRRPIANVIQGVLFVDAGDAWGSNYTLPVTADPNGRFTQHTGIQPKLSAGMGIRLTTPIGPLRLDWATGNEGSRAHFSIGHVF